MSELHAGTTFIFVHCCVFKHSSSTLPTCKCRCFLIDNMTKCGVNNHIEDTFNLWPAFSDPSGHVIGRKQSLAEPLAPSVCDIHIMFFHTAQV